VPLSANNSLEHGLNEKIAGSRAGMGYVNALRAQRPSPEVRPQQISVNVAPPAADRDAVAALRRAIGPGLAEVVLFQR
jgi:hypothetical protein